jgi:hypothetical protein
MNGYHFAGMAHPRVDKVSDAGQLLDKSRLLLQHVFGIVGRRLRAARATRRQNSHFLKCGLVHQVKPTLAASIRAFHFARFISERQTPWAFAEELPIFRKFGTTCVHRHDVHSGAF